MSRIVSFHPDHITCEGQPGDHIKRAIKYTKWDISLQPPSYRYAVLKFNDSNLTIYRRTVPGRKFREWQRTHEHKEKLFCSSAAGRRYEKERWQRLQAAQAELDASMAMLRGAKDTRGVIEWLKRFTPAADNCGVIWDKASVLFTLKAMGFESGAKVDTDVLQWSDEDCADWIVGQAINCIERMGCPYPMSVSFCADWLDGSWKAKTRARIEAEDRVNKEVQP